MGDSLPRDSRPITETSPLSRTLKGPIAQASTLGWFLGTGGEFYYAKRDAKGKYGNLCFSIKFTKFPPQPKIPHEVNHPMSRASLNFRRRSPYINRKFHASFTGDSAGSSKGWVMSCGRGRHLSTLK